MKNPFDNYTLGPAGPATDILPVTPDDVTDLPVVASAIYVETGGALSVLTVAGGIRTVTVVDHSFLPVGIARVRATGTTASGIHALVVA